MKKVMLIYPPGKLFQRGEDRCQSNIESSTATSIRACNDLGYCASVLENEFEIFLKDYQTENLSLEDLKEDYIRIKPDVLFVSVTNATIFQDLDIINELKQLYNSACVILKGALFLNAEKEMLNQLKLDNVDYLIATEAECVIKQILNAHYNDKSQLKNISGILYKENAEWIQTDFDKKYDDLDLLPFPARHLMKNSLYILPDTGEVQATIATSRGCPSSCIFCLTPKLTGKKIRFRSAKNIFDELLECYSKYGIKNFFFKSDTFTMNKEWTIELCNYIINSELNKKIKWVANSRVNPIDEETLLKMKEAGCHLIAFGFESGSQKTLNNMKKGTTVEQNIEAARLAKKVGLSVYGFFMIGLPWEDEEDLKATKDLIFKINADFIELHIATPFYGTDFYKIAKDENLIDNDVLGKDYFNVPTLGTKYLSIDKLSKFRKKVILQYHLRPTYILKKLSYAILRPNVLKNYFKYGIRLIKNNLGIF